MSNTLMFVLIFSGIFGLLGFTFSVIGICILRNRKKKEKNCTSKIYGKVKDVIRHQSYSSDGGYNSSWHPVYEYNVGELKFIKESLYGSSQSKFAIGQDIEIYCNPENYNEYYVPEENLPNIIGKTFTIIGIVMIIIAIVVAILMLY